MRASTRLKKFFAGYSPGLTHTQKTFEGDFRQGAPQKKFFGGLFWLTSAIHELVDGAPGQTHDVNKLLKALFRSAPPLNKFFEALLLWQGGVHELVYAVSDEEHGVKKYFETDFARKGT